MAEGAEGGFYVAHEFVDALGVLATGHSGIAAGDAFDEVHERLLCLACVADLRRAFRAREAVFEKFEEAAAFGYEDVGFGAERTPWNRFCRRREVFEQPVRVVGFAVEDAAHTLFPRRQTIEAAIGKLERELKKEKQFNRQFEISGEIRKLKAEFNSIHS